MTTADSGQLATGDPINAILEISNDITSFGNARYTAAAANLTASSNPNSVNRTFTGSWTSSVVHEVKFTFASSNAARFFFNAGGKITHVWNLSGHTSDDKANEWVDRIRIFLPSQNIVLKWLWHAVWHRMIWQCFLCLFHLQWS